MSYILLYIIAFTKRDGFHENGCRSLAKIKDGDFCNIIYQIFVVTVVLATLLTSCVFSGKQSISHSPKVFISSKNLFPDLLAPL